MSRPVLRLFDGFESTSPGLRDEVRELHKEHRKEDLQSTTVDCSEATTRRTCRIAPTGFKFIIGQNPYGERPDVLPMLFLN